MNLQEFIQSVPMTVESFVEATKRAAVTDPSMDPSLDRAESWWYKDVAAYLEYLEVDEEIKWNDAPTC